MKNLTQYNIFEKLDAEHNEFFINIYDTEKNVLGKLDKPLIDIDVKNLKKPKNHMQFYDMEEKSIKSIIDDNKLGFTTVSQLLNNQKKYISDDEDKISKIKFFPYFYITENTTYFSGLILYSTDNLYIDNYIELIYIEPALFVNKSINIIKGIFNDFLDMIKKDKKYEGIYCYAKHPKVNSLMQKLKFKKSDMDKNIYIYKL